MTTFTVGGLNSDFATIATAMAGTSAGDTLLLAAGYSNETATVTHTGMTIDGGLTSTGIVLQLATTPTIANITLTGVAPISVLDAPNGNGIVGNDGDNIITVVDGADAVNGGAGTDRLVVDYHLATTAVTGDSTSSFADTGSRLVTINGGFENFTVLTGSGADTLTVGDGTNVINAGSGANTITAGIGSNHITGGSDADTITAGNGNSGNGDNVIDGGDGTNTITAGTGNDTISGGVGADTIVAGAGADLVTVRGGADTSDGGAGDDRLVVDYSAFNTSMSGGVASGTLGGGFTGSIGDGASNSVGFTTTENFTVTTGGGVDNITTGDGADVLRLGKGDDVLHAAGGDDIINYTVGDGADTTDGGAGNDILAIAGTAGNDWINVVVNLGVVTGLAGGSVAGIEHVTLALGDGTHDTLSFGGTGGAETVNLATHHATGFDSITGVENVVGGAGFDHLTGNAAANMLVGGLGRDTLSGGKGRDTLVGGDGVDTLTGGSGADHFVFNTAPGATNFDHVTDFQAPLDKIFLGHAVFHAAGGIGVLAAGAFFAGPAAHDNNDRIIYNPVTGEVTYDSNGSAGGGATHFATLAPHLALDHSDFMVVA